MSRNSIYKKILNCKCIRSIKKRPLPASLIIVVTLWLANFLVIFINKENAGTIGDQFGVVNALFSGLAFVGLIYTILQQHKSLELQRQDLKNQLEELKLNRRELELSRDEMSNQTQEFEKQNESLKIQRFESTFFNMLGLLQEIVGSLEFTYRIPESTMTTDLPTSIHALPPRSVKGREVFKFVFDNHTALIGADCNASMFTEIAKTGMRKILATNQWDGYASSELPEYFDHYFRHIYRILKFIDQSPLLIDFEDRYQYAAILRGQLSRYEMVWLYYNCLSDYGCEKFKPLIEKYSMLKNLRKDLLVTEFKCEGEYQPSAFGKEFAGE